MKLICILLSLLCGLCSAAPAGTETKSAVDVTHFFTHALIAYPELAFAEGNEMRTSYDKDCLTVSEFKSFLEELYRNNYMLVDVNEVYAVSGTGGITKNFKFPKGKKPLVLSFDDINYYIKKMHLGMNDKLVATADGKLATYTRDADQKYNYDNETITIVENFVKKHPDFSYHNAKGVICLTGFDGILGYRTMSGSPNRESETAEAKNVVKLLKAGGWKFACHSYGHYHMKKLSDDRFILDTKKWMDEVSPLIGKTDIYTYPYGEWEINRGAKIGKKHQFLVDSGFRLFLGVGVENFYGYLPFEKTACPKTLFMDRKPVDGLSLRKCRKQYSECFDAWKVYDHEHRFIKF